MPKIASLKNTTGVTIHDVETTDEYLSLKSTYDEWVARCACVLYLRGSCNTMDEATRQARLQAGIAATGRDKLVDFEMIWVPSWASGGRADNDFVKLLDGRGNQFSTTGYRSTVNCWEAVLLAAIVNGQIAITDRLRQIYESRQFEKDLIHVLTSGARFAYTSSKLEGTPQAGDIVLFNKLDHVAVATGRRIVGVQLPEENVRVPGYEIVNFWPAPAIGPQAFQPPVPTTVYRTSIEAVQKWYTTVFPNDPPLVVEFGSPNWQQLT